MGIDQASAPVAEITETETTERQVRPAAGNINVAVPTPVPKTTGVETGVVGDVDVPVARVVEKETTERHIEPAVSGAVHTSAAKDTAINTGIMDAQAREVGEIVETATVSRNVIPSVGPKVELPVNHADISTNRGTTTLNVGTVGQASQVVGEVVDTEVVSRDLEKTRGAAAAPHPHTEAIATGVVGRTAQQVAEVHERETLQRDLHSVHGASVPVAAGVATTAHV